MDFRGLDQSFFERVTLPGGRKLAAIDALMLVADLGGPGMFARIGLLRALNRHHVREFNPKHNEPHWGRRKLRRDQ